MFLSCMFYFLKACFEFKLITLLSVFGRLRLNFKQIAFRISLSLSLPLSPGIAYSLLYLK